MSFSYCLGNYVPSRNRWVNRKDVKGRNIFSGGFLGLDNIGVFDRSKPLPTGGCLAQVSVALFNECKPCSVMASCICKKFRPMSPCANCTG